ncbi:MAG: carboxymuconolactone decarboxylase family protein [Deltaproteobacteria bacterium]|nr:carboxymuconolactone decarboxylase family protein [Deltaproteobacteria bacterium]
MAGVYREIRSEVPRVPNLMQVFSLRPETMEGLYRSWLSSMWNGSVDRQTRELMAMAVARAARCDYCVDSHLVFLQACGMDRDQAFAIERDSAAIEDLPEPVRVAMELASRLTSDPRNLCDEDLQALRRCWPVLEQRVELISVAAGFNCITRVANALGVDQEIPRSVRRFEAGRRGAISLLSRLTAVSVDMEYKPVPARPPEENLRALDFLFFSQLGFASLPPGFTVLQHCPEMFDGQLRLMEKAVAVMPRDRWMRLGLVIGKLTGCDYFSENCAAWLEQRGVDTADVVAAAEGAQSSLADAEKCCLRFARDLTLHSHTMDESRVRGLRAAGLSDGAILDLTFVSGVFNGMVRHVAALAVEESVADEPGSLVERTSAAGHLNGNAPAGDDLP